MIKYYCQPSYLTASMLYIHNDSNGNVYVVYLYFSHYFHINWKEKSNFLFVLSSSLNALVLCLIKNCRFIDSFMYINVYESMIFCESLCEYTAEVCNKNNRNNVRSLTTLVLFKTHLKKFTSLARCVSVLLI